MKDATIRLEGIEIRNFKNVCYGKLNFENSRKFYDSSILGLYGQNGSGKTALIDAIALLKFALTGQEVPYQFADYVNIDASFANLKYFFKVKDLLADAEYNAVYEFNIRKETRESSQKYKTVIFGEVLSYSYESKDEKLKLQSLIDTRTDDVFVPVSKYNELVGSGKDTKTTLIAHKKFALISSKSFVFSSELLDVIRVNCKEKRHLFLIKSLVFYGNRELFVINTANSGFITVNGLPLNFKYEEKGEISTGIFMVNLNEPTWFSEKDLDDVKKIIENMNIVLAKLVPGLTIGVKELGTELAEDASKKVKIQLVSRKDSKEIPLKYESEGIKKIISVLQLLIVVYNNPSITVAIDELDSGIFEYLLGELLRIISKKGAGQLIFTSHNLRPLETIDRGFIAFTTTNPNNRYIRLTNIKTNNNLRDFYYRDIVLGEQSESVYDSTNNYEIDLAFSEAGETSIETGDNK